MEAATAAKPRAELDDEALASELEDAKGPEDGEPTGGPEPEPTAEEPPTPPAALPDDGGEDEDEESAEQLYLVGDRELGLKVGGRKPDSAVLKFKGGKLELLGGPDGKGSQFDRSDRFTTVDVWQVTGDNDQDTIDKLSGEVKSTSKAQNATLCGTKRIEEWLKERLVQSFSPDEIQSVFSALDLEVPED